MNWAEFFFALVLVHLVADYCLQSDSVAVGKNPANSPYKTVPWYYWMAGHVAAHAAGVWLVTGSAALAAMEFAAHYAIDWWKCAQGRGLKPADVPEDGRLVAFLVHLDQAAHVLCKAMIAGVAVVWARG